MWPFKKIRKWKRVDFDPPPNEQAQAHRNKAEEDADHDLQKPVQQFLCDVHEEANRPPCEKSKNQRLTYAEDRILDAIDKLSCENKRMVALQTVTAYAANRTAWCLIFLTIILVILTFFLIRPYFSFNSSELLSETRKGNEITNQIVKNNNIDTGNQNVPKPKIFKTTKECIQQPQPPPNKRINSD